MGNLYGLRGDRGNAEILLIQLNGQLQESLSALFPIYRDQFLEPVEDELQFDGGYTPDDDQLVYVDITGEMVAILEEMRLGPAGRERFLPGDHFSDEFRALIWFHEVDGEELVLIQNFTRAQALSRRGGAIMQWTNNETFKNFDSEVIFVDQKIHGFIRNERFYFKKFHTAKRIFDLEHEYREATAEDIEAFLEHENISCEDEESFVENLNTRQRKLIFSVNRSGQLDEIDAAEILERSQGFEVNIEVVDDTIQLPSGPHLTKVLEFFDHRLYRSPINDGTYLANSRRPL